MKIVYKLLLINYLLVVIVGCSPIFAQNTTVTYSGIKQVNEFVEISLTSSTPLYDGARRYVLHIANQFFMKSKHKIIEGQSILTFYIPLSDYQRLPNKAEIILVYGYSDSNVDISAEKSKTGSSSKEFSGNYWLTGTFNKMAIKIIPTPSNN